jgi:hypothetical protein
MVQCQGCRPLEQDHWARAHLLEILHGKASLVAAGIRRSATLRTMAAALHQPLDHCADYLLKYSPCPQYDKELADGVPIVTGVIEDACHHLAEDRMNLTGACWSLSGAEAALRLRALRSSHDFDAYWKFNEEQEYARNHASHYSDHYSPIVALPAVRLSHPSRRSTLTIIKKKVEPQPPSHQRPGPDFHRYKKAERAPPMIKRLLFAGVETNLFG